MLHDFVGKIVRVSAPFASSSSFEDFSTFGHAHLPIGLCTSRTSELNSMHGVFNPSALRIATEE